MSALLAWLSMLLWWVLYSSLAALGSALVAWVVLRWAERCNVVFNRVYLACLVWSLLGALLLGGVAAYEGRLHPPYGALLASAPLRLALAADMLLGAMLLWRLVPRADARRIRFAGACMAVAVIAVVGFGALTSLA
ncbi:hypothetical protein [Frateuria defendens]|uniref:hypothetical protein n=1 Tax=Frateuria defendens TaxID=2219559 RepID=UPI00066FF954|nr:hypothetical protein [Frateuria defendens]